MRRKISTPLRRNILRNLRNLLCLFLILALLFVFRSKQLHSSQVRNRLSIRAMKLIDYKEKNYDTNIPVDTLKKVIAQYNQEEKILNHEISRSLKTDAPVVVIFVDKNKIHLKYLIASLENVFGIADALIIFSHSYFDENVNNLVTSIDFAPVVQIFYPYSLQLYPTEFPGYHPSDCPRDTGVHSARYANCTGANTPDLNGKYRDPVLSQEKHFWWWTLNTVFERLSHTKKHKGTFIFINDDVFLLKDFLFMTTQMKKTSKFISKCDIISLMKSDDPDLSEIRTYGAEITTWDPKHHSRVIAFDIHTWNIIAAHYYIFCYFEDYSWSRSLFQISLNRKDGKRFKVIFSTIPRAFKTNKLSSISKHLVTYNVLNTVYDILELQEQNNEILFPNQLEIYLNIELKSNMSALFDYADSNSGWADERDKQMCTNITENKVKKLILDMNSQFNAYTSDDDVVSDDDSNI